MLTRQNIKIMHRLIWYYISLQAIEIPNSRYVDVDNINLNQNETRITKVARSSLMFVSFFCTL